MSKGTCPLDTRIVWCSKRMPQKGPLTDKKAKSFQNLPNMMYIVAASYQLVGGDIKKEL